MRFISLLDLIIIAVGIVVLLFWFFLYFKGKKYQNLFINLEDEDYPMKELYFVGYAFTQMIHLKYRAKKDRDLRKKISILYGEKYIDYYLRASYSQRFTMALTILVLAMPVYCFTRSLIMYFFVYVFAGVAYYYYGTVLDEKIQKRSDEMMDDFSNVVSKLALLVNAGMILHEAWEKTAFSGNTVIYKEMQTSVEDMRNGMPEIDALYNFGQRCMVQEIKKFASTLIQGLTKGNSELAGMLTQQSKEIWVSKQQYLRRKGEVANSKLLVPMIMIFMGILIMVVIPIFNGIG